MNCIISGQIFSVICICPTGCLIFVDNFSSLNSGLIWFGNNDEFFIGNAENEKFNNEINCFIDKVIEPKTLSQNIVIKDTPKVRFYYRCRFCLIYRQKRHR